MRDDVCAIDTGRTSDETRGIVCPKIQGGTGSIHQDRGDILVCRVCFVPQEAMVVDTGVGYTAAVRTARGYVWKEK